MSIRKSKLSDSIRDLAREDRQRIDAHLTPDELLEYHYGRMSGDHKEHAQDHLALCGTCARTLLDMAAFPDLEPADDRRPIASEQIADDWRAMQRLVEDEALGPERAASEQSQDLAASEQTYPGTSPSHRVYALAATFLAACFGLLFWNVSLRSEVQKLRQPSLNVTATSLTATDAAGVRSTGAERVTFVQTDEHILLNLDLFLLNSAGPYEMILLDARGEVLSQKKGLRQTEELDANVLLPAGSLAPGDYRIHFYRLQDTEGKPFKEFVFSID